MGAFAEETARDYQFTRAEHGRLRAREPGPRARRRSAAARFADEVVPVTVPGRGGDERRSPRTSSRARREPDKIPTLKPAFAKDGTITAANAVVDLRRRAPRWC